MTDKTSMFALRIPDTLKEAMKEAATRNNRSITAEIIYRLEYTIFRDAKQREARESRESRIRHESARHVLSRGTPPGLEAEWEAKQAEARSAGETLDRRLDEGKANTMRQLEADPDLAHKEFEKNPGTLSRLFTDGDMLKMKDMIEQMKEDMDKLKTQIEEKK